MVKVYDFKKGSKADCISMGRNGTMQTTGLEIMSMEHRGAIRLTPINSKGLAGNCFIEVPAKVWKKLAKGGSNV